MCALPCGSLCLCLQLEEHILVSQTFLLLYCRVSVMQTLQNPEKACYTAHLLRIWVAFKKQHRIMIKVSKGAIMLPYCYTDEEASFDILLEYKWNKARKNGANSM